MLFFLVLGILLTRLDITSAGVGGINVVIVLLSFLELVGGSLFTISNSLAGSKLLLGEGLGLEDLLGGVPLPEVKDDREGEPRPEAGNLKLGALGRVTKGLEKGHGQSLVRPEGVRGTTVNLPNVRSLAQGLLELVATTGEKTNRKHTKDSSHEEGKPLLVVELTVAPVQSEADGKAQDDTNGGGKGDSNGTLAEEEGDEEDTALGDLTPDVPGNVEADGLERQANNDAVGAHLLASVDAEPLGDLERELEDADGGNDLAHALDDVGGLLVEVLREDGEGNGDGDDDQDGHEGGQEGGVGDALETRLELVFILVPIGGLLKDGAVEMV